MRLLSLVTVIFLLGPIDGLPILPGSDPDPAARPDSDGFPDVGAARFLDSVSGPAAAVWGSVDCESPTRVRRVRRGDPSEPPSGAAPRSTGARRIGVHDGDEFYGERCELGRNDHRTSPVAVYREGERLVTYASIKLAQGFPLQRERWQVVMQMKQAQPYDSGSSLPVLALHAYDRRWRLWTSGAEATGERLLWTGRAQPDAWVRFGFDVTYSTDPTLGALRVSADLNGDGDALDRDERSERFELRTLVPEGPGGTDDGLGEGDSIPSHLRAGVYHDPVYRCEAGRCAVKLDNVGVYEPN